MKKFIPFLFLIFFLGCDRGPLIKDFKIDGIGLGDSLLDNFTKQEILGAIERDWDMYSSLDDTYKQTSFFAINQDYDHLDFFVKPDDPKYLTYSVGGRINYDNDLEGCLRKKDEIINEFVSMFNNVERSDYDNIPFSQDSSGESISYSAIFALPTGVEIGITCNSYGSNLEKEFDLIDNFSVTIDTPEFIEWMYY